jgi:predicted flap endonuclease-1-like 5' DNA nuclease
MNPLLWWWRWWSRVINPNRDEALVKAEEAIDEQRAKADRLSSELEAKDAEIAALQKRLSQSDSKVEDLQTRLGRAERAQPAAVPPEPQIAQAAAAPPEPPIAQPAAAPPETQKAQPAAAQPKTQKAQPAAKPAEPPDVSTATEALGTRIKLDDLTVIEGIGPKIAQLLSNAGFTTWQALSEADSTQLRRMLDDAGPRYRIHDPSKWPPQAALLAHGQWQEFKDLRVKLRQRTS